MKTETGIIQLADNILKKKDRYAKRYKKFMKGMLKLRRRLRRWKR